MNRGLRPQTAMFPHFDPTDEALAGLSLAGLLPPVHAGQRVWCHALALGAAEVAHLYFAAGTEVPGWRARGALAVIRVGEGWSLDGAPPTHNFIELVCYPDGAMPAMRYVRETHEFLIDFATPGLGLAAGRASATALGQAWKLILTLRLKADEPAEGIAAATALLKQLQVSAAAEKMESVQKARMLLERFRGIRSAELAAALNVTEAHLCRHFKRAFGVTIGHYTNILRLARAGGLLWGTRLPLSDIAERCGYADQAHLTRALSRIMLASPLKFRKLAPCIGKPITDHLGFLQPRN